MSPLKTLSERMLRALKWRASGRCLLCDANADNPPLAICSGCEADLPWLGAHCLVCALPLTHHGLTCGECLKHRPSFARVEAPWRYEFPVASLINRFKHRGDMPFGRLLADLLTQHVQHALAQGLPRPDGLIAVPLSRTRQRQRGFNQAQMLSQWLSRQLHIDTLKDVLIRTADAPAQQQLDARSRKRNLRHAFNLHPDASVNGLHLALVDDVLTTGATADTLARLLLRAGATRVDVYCLARTPKPGDST